MTRCEGNETTIRTWRHVFTGAVAGHNKERLPSRVMFRTMAGGENRENPKAREQLKHWHRCVVEDPRELRATELQRNTPSWCSEVRPSCGSLQLKGKDVVLRDS